MGGFELFGKRHVIYSTAPVVCFCTGFRDLIDEDTETKLLNKTVQVLDPVTDLPTYQRADFLSSHIPTDLSYAIRLRDIDDFRPLDSAPLNVDGQENWNSPLATFTETAN